MSQSSVADIEPNGPFTSRPLSQSLPSKSLLSNLYRLSLHFLLLLLPLLSRESFKIDQIQRAGIQRR